MSLEIRNLTSDNQIFSEKWEKFWYKVESDEYSKRPVFCIEDKINLQAWTNFWHESWLECPKCHRRS